MTYPYMIVREQPLYILTHQDCDNSESWDPKEFTKLGLAYGMWDKDPYPLTDEETNLITYHSTKTPAGGCLMFGSTALYQGQKWLMPSIEYIKPVDHQALKNERWQINKLIKPYQGFSVVDEDSPEDRHTVLILVPLAKALETFKHVNAWKSYLECGLGIIDQRTVIEHVSEGCQCEGKRCTSCQQALCHAHFRPLPAKGNILNAQCRICELRKLAERRAKARRALCETHLC